MNGNKEERAVAAFAGTDTGPVKVKWIRVSDFPIGGSSVNRVLFLTETAAGAKHYGFFALSTAVVPAWLTKLKEKWAGDVNLKYDEDTTYYVDHKTCDVVKEGTFEISYGPALLNRHYLAANISDYP